MLCRIFQKSGLGPPNGDRYAPFIEEEWDEDAPLLIPGGDVEDDVANGDMDLDQVLLFTSLSRYIHAWFNLRFALDFHACVIYK